MTEFCKYYRNGSCKHPFAQWLISGQDNVQSANTAAEKPTNLDDTSINNGNMDKLLVTGDNPVVENVILVGRPTLLSTDKKTYSNRTGIYCDSGGFETLQRMCTGYEKESK